MRLNSNVIGHLDRTQQFCQLFHKAYRTSKQIFPTKMKTTQRKRSVGLVYLSFNLHESSEDVQSFIDAMHDVRLTEIGATMVLSVE